MKQVYCLCFINTGDVVVQEVASCLSVTAKAEQIDIILKLSQGKDVLAKLPTGFGKSFLYQAFIIKIALLQEKYNPHSVIVVSPLVSLVQDQLQALSKSQLKIKSVVADSDEYFDDISDGRFHVGEGVVHNVS